MAKMNPKYIQAQKDGKAPLEYIPLHIFESVSHVLKHGADKYGKHNWRESRILLSTYKGAILRHLTAFALGERIDPDSGHPHLAHIIACCIVALDAERFGTAIDDLNDVETKEVNL